MSNNSDHALDEALRLRRALANRINEAAEHGQRTPFNWAGVKGVDPSANPHRGTAGDPLGVESSLDAAGHSDAPPAVRTIVRRADGTFYDQRTGRPAWGPTKGLRDDGVRYVDEADLATDDH